MLFHRTYLLHQLSEWDREKATKYIDYDRLKLYVLLAGLMVWEVTGVNVCKDLDWKRALALHLCYGCGLTAPVREVINKYNKAFQVSSPQNGCFNFINRHPETRVYCKISLLKYFR